MGIPTAAGGTASGTAPAGDLANAVVAGVFTAAAQASKPYAFLGAFNVIFGGTGGENTAWTGSVQLERSYDGGVTWWVCNIGGGGQQAIYTTGTDVGFVVGEPELGMLYRLKCTALSLGTITYRMSTYSPAPTAWGIPPS